MSNLFQLGRFVLNSGAVSEWKLECDALTIEDWKALGKMILKIVGPVSEVFGVPRGGLALEEAIKPHLSTMGRKLIVDDVLTTGGSMERLRDRLTTEKQIPYYDFTGAVVFARGKCPEWISPLFQMPKPLWLPSKNTANSI